MRPQVGQVINNKYRLLRLIGDGGMGSVYEARHEVLGTSVALKFLHPELSRRQGLVQRFLQEAKVSAQIHSPHVVRVTDVDQNATGQAFIVLEYLEGKTLQTLYEDLYREGRRLSYADALEYAMQMLEGVEAAHRTGIVHRDLKPDNVMITKGPKGAPLLKLLDFGIAKLKVTGELDRGLTRPGVIMGTPEYMAPEQAYSADTVDVRADIFSLGVMIFEMLAGRRPVGGDDPQQIASAYLSGQVAKLSDLMPQLAPELTSAVQKAMAPMPKNRFDSVAEFRDALEPFAQAVRPAFGNPSNPGIGPTPSPAAVTPHAPGPSPAAAAPPTNLPLDNSRAVPKTLPPDPGGGAPVDVRIAGPTPLGGFGSPGGPSWAGHGQQAMSPGLATTETNPPYQPAGAATSFASPLEMSPRPSGTAIGGPVYNGGPGAPYGGGYGGAGTAPMSHPYAAVAPTAPAPSLEPRRNAARKGPPLLLILLLAGGVAGLVVGGLYAANHYAKAEDHKIEPIAVTPTTTVASDPQPVNRPATNPPITTAKPPPVTNVPQPSKPPTSKPPTTPGQPAPSTQPSTQPSVIILPTALPEFPFPVPPPFVPLPGQNPPPQPQPQGGTSQPPQGGGTTPPQGGGTTPPQGGGTTPPQGGGTSPPPTNTGRRPGGIILIPRH